MANSLTATLRQGNNRGQMAAFFFLHRQNLQMEQDVLPGEEQQYHNPGGVGVCPRGLQKVGAWGTHTHCWSRNPRYCAALQKTVPQHCIRQAPLFEIAFFPASPGSPPHHPEASAKPPAAQVRDFSGPNPSHEGRALAQGLGLAASGEPRAGAAGRAGEVSSLRRRGTLSPTYLPLLPSTLPPPLLRAPRLGPARGRARRRRPVGPGRGRCGGGGGAARRWRRAGAG